MTILGDSVGANGGSPEEEALSKTQGLFRGQKSLKETVEAEDYVVRQRFPVPRIRQKSTTTA